MSEMKYVCEECQAAPATDDFLEYCDPCLQEILQDRSEPDLSAVSASETQARVNEEAYGPNGYKR